MTSISDFVNHRWSDARTEFAKLDEDFVSKLDSTVRLESLGLKSPWPPPVDLIPKQRLSSEWHRLLESCIELLFLIGILEASASSLTVSANAHLPPEEVGKRHGYHFRSWFIHAKTLADRATKVIEQTADIYISDPDTRKAIVTQLREKMRSDVTQHIDQQRNHYAHGTMETAAKELTRNDLWEGLIAGWPDHEEVLRRYYYVPQGQTLLDGEYSHFVDTTAGLLGAIASILEKLESQVPKL